MSFDRIERISGEVMRELSGILREIKDPRMKGMISILAVKVAKDLSHAKVILSVLGTDEDKKSTLAALKSASGFIRRELSGRVDLRITPQLSFEISDSIEHEIHISKIIEDALKGSKGNNE